MEILSMFIISWYLVYVVYIRQYLVYIIDI